MNPHDYSDDIREYIFLAEELNSLIVHAPAIVEEETDKEPDAPVNEVLLHDLKEMADKMRGFMETESGDYALGVETGMQRAAEMVESLIRRYTNGDQIG